MKFTPTTVDGAWVVSIEPRTDDRGFFARSFCRDEFLAHGLNTSIAQCNVARTARAGTLRGLHYQLAPHAESKLMRCTAGAIFDVVADIRRESPTFGRWVGVELTAGNHDQLYVPEGCAHGYLTLADDTEVCYQVSAPYAPGAERGIRWDDPLFRIAWPIAPVIIHPRDRGYEDFRP